VQRPTSMWVKKNCPQGWSRKRREGRGQRNALGQGGGQLSSKKKKKNRMEQNRGSKKKSGTKGEVKDLASSGGGGGKQRFKVGLQESEKKYDEGSGYAFPGGDQE